MKKRLLTGLAAVLMLMGACAAPAVTAEADVPAPTIDTTPSATPLPTPIKTTQPDEPLKPEIQTSDAQPAQTQETAQPTPQQGGGYGTVRVRPGDTLEQHIIPQLEKAYDISTSEIKEALAAAQSKLIGSKIKGFRRMEGIIVPGKYEVDGKTLEQQIGSWIKAAEERYDKLAAAVGEKNSLNESQQLNLASIVEWECLGLPFESQAAAVFLNRLRDKAKLRSCATTEYALGYSRPYMTSADVATKNEYNTYQVNGLPPGPICAASDASLRASIAKAADSQIYYFFYDYAPRSMQFFVSYEDFKAAANVSTRLFDETFPDIGRYDKLDRRAVFGTY